MEWTVPCSVENSSPIKRNQIFQIIILITFHAFLCRSEQLQNCSEILQKGSIQIYNDTTTNCVNNWMNNRKKQFNVCKTRLCFVFLEQEPHVIMEKQHRVPKTPFKCNKAAELGVSGAIFEIFTKLPSDYMCIWGGPREDCTFNHLVNFLYHYKETHQFAFANFLVDLPIRRCMHNIGVPLLDDRIVIIGRVMDNKGNTYSPSRMFTNLLKPFHSETWIVFSALFLTIFTLAALVVRFLGPKKELSLSRTLLFLMGNHEVAQDPHHHRYTISIISLFLNSSIVALSAIMVLFYEIAVVNFLFRQSSIPSLIDVGSIPHEDLMQYCVNKNSAVDIVWRSSCKFYSYFNMLYIHVQEAVSLQSPRTKDGITQRL